MNASPVLSKESGKARDIRDRDWKLRLCAVRQRILRDKMRALLIYDIPSDRIRLKVSEACLDYGLERIQYSAFFGDLSGNHLDELMQRLARLLGREEGKIQVFPICEKDLKLRRDLISLRLKKPVPVR